MRNQLYLILLLMAAEPDRVLRPLNETVLKPGPVSIVAKTTGELLLDGKAIPSTQPAPGVRTATVTPSAGLHELAAGNQKVRFFVGAGAPQGWKEFRAHPPAATCDACHAVEDGAWSIKAGETCFRCHDQATFPKIHQHNSEVLAECQMCHNPHGSTEKAHLKLAKEVACKQCHG